MPFRAGQIRHYKRVRFVIYRYEGAPLAECKTKILERNTRIHFRERVGVENEIETLFLSKSVISAQYAN